LIVNVTIPASEQVKIPVWTDIKVLMTIDWSSSQFTRDSEESLVFQNLLYTILFNPRDNFLIPKVT
jgi:hypothetical protein